MRIRDLNISARARACLLGAGYELLEELKWVSDMELLSIKNMNESCVSEIRNAIVEFCSEDEDDEFTDDDFDDEYEDDDYEDDEFSDDDADDNIDYDDFDDEDYEDNDEDFEDSDCEDDDTEFEDIEILEDENLQIRLEFCGIEFDDDEERLTLRFWADNDADETYRIWISNLNFNDEAKASFTFLGEIEGHDSEFLERQVAPEDIDYEDINSLLFSLFITNMNHKQLATSDGIVVYCDTSDETFSAVKIRNQSSIISDNTEDEEDYEDDAEEDIDNSDNDFEDEEEDYAEENGNLDKERRDIDGITIEEMEFSKRTYTFLKLANINTVNQLIHMTMDELKTVRNLGRKSHEEIVNKLQELGLSLSTGTNDKDACESGCLFDKSKGFFFNIEK